MRRLLFKNSTSIESTMKQLLESLHSTTYPTCYYYSMGNPRLLHDIFPDNTRYPQMESTLIITIIIIDTCSQADRHDQPKDSLLRAKTHHHHDLCFHFHTYLTQHHYHGSSSSWLLTRGSPRFWDATMKRTSSCLGVSRVKYLTIQIIELPSFQFKISLWWCNIVLIGIPPFFCGIHDDHQPLLLLLHVQSNGTLSW